LYLQTDATLLSHAVSKGNVGAVHLLLVAGADPGWKNSKGNTALMLAAWKGDVNMGQELLQLSNGEVTTEARRRLANLGTHDGWTPLHAAVEGGHLDFGRLLLQHGANASAAMTTTGWTPLHAAAKKDKGPMVRLLLEYKANKMARASHRDFGKDKMPGEIAKSQEVVNLLRSQH
jgi:cytohesin